MIVYIRLKLSIFERVDNNTYYTLLHHYFIRNLLCMYNTVVNF